MNVIGLPWIFASAIFLTIAIGLATTDQIRRSRRKVPIGREEGRKLIPAIETGFKPLPAAAIVALILAGLSLIIFTVLNYKL